MSFSHVKYILNKTQDLNYTFVNLNLIYQIHESKIHVEEKQDKKHF